MISRRQACCGLAAGGVAILSGTAIAASGFDPSATVRHLARVTRDEYHDARLGRQIADHLIAALRQGRLDASGAEALATQLNREIAAASKDAHFVVMAGAMAHLPPVPPTEPHSETPPFNDGELAYLKRRNFGIAAAEVLDGNIGRLAIGDQFYRPAKELRERLALAMGFVADTSGLIVDLRTAYGGDPKSVAHYLSYFFDRPPFVLNRFRWRNRPPEEFRTTRDPGGPLYGERRPVAVLVSRSTVSAPEEFAYNMKALRRGTIIGERTQGAANHALPVPIAGGFTAFIPKARAENPVTGTNWEGVGVEPDVAADPPTVTDAHRVILERLRIQR